MEFTPVTTDAQIKQTATLAKEIWSEHFPPIIGQEQVDYMLKTIQSKDAICDQIRNKGYIYYLIENNNKAVGYCAIQPQEESLFLSKLYILECMRGKGIARQAVDFIKTIAAKKGLSKITLTCNKNNTSPIAVYEKLGFTNTGSTIQDIGNGFVMDDYKMELSLT